MRPRPSINILPFVDVLLLLVLSLMAIFTQAASASAREDKDPERISVVLRITEENQFMMNDQEFESAQDLLNYMNREIPKSTCIKCEWNQSLLIKDMFILSRTMQENGYKTIQGQQKS